MQFFDLNIPYLESDKLVSDISSIKRIRLKQIVKLMELGYSGIAYNRTIKGVMSESDRCTISPFPLSCLLNVSPSLSSSVAFHRRLLGVPEKCAFRQYSRLTMVVDTTVQSSALNSGNPVLKTYDLIAVRPLKQNCFDIACQSSQVDLISIDLTKSLPFRLKLPMVKAAICGRGVYFEIVYSSLMQDIQMRKQTIMNAKLLVEWTRGKNLIISSAAPSVLELRGPNDVVNLLSLFGLTSEFAKATISKNCRLLIANALRKKHFHKEAIRVEEMPSGALTKPKEPWIVDHVDWDPLSSGEGDLLLDDMAKAFAEIGKVSQTNKDIGFSSINGDVQSHGLQVKDFKFRTEGSLSTCGNFTGSISPFKDNVVSKITEKPQNEPTLCCSLPDKQDDAVEDSQQAVLPDFPINSTNAGGFPLSTCGNFTGSISPSKDSVVSKNTEKPQNEHTLCCSLPDKQDDAVEDSQQAVLPDFPINSTHAGGFSINSSISSQELKKFYAFETSTSPVRLSELELQRHAGIHEDKVLLSNKKNELTSKDDGFVVGCIAGSRQQVFTNCESPNYGVSQSENFESRFW
ncbi:Ribonuclease P protein subunit p30 [Bienertia sinuspersici]